MAVSTAPINSNRNHRKEPTLMNALKNLLKDENGATLVEYGIIVALIAVVCIGVITTLGKTIQGQFTTINADL
jgi:pilus assembly protein Flp/PilA